MILRNLDFNLSLYLVKGVSRFYKTDVPLFYDGILFKDLQSSKLYVQEEKQEESDNEDKDKDKDKKKDSFFFFCLGLKTDTSLVNIPFYTRDKKEDKKETKDLKSNNSKEVVIDSYYTSYTYKFKFGVLKFLKRIKVRNTVRFFKITRYKKRRRLRRFLDVLHFIGT